jgi:nucleotide-binding universal stress UspA family protein
MGSVSDSVVRHAHCPVMVVRHKNATQEATSNRRDLSEQGGTMSIFPTRILLATDGSEEAQLALSTAVDQANSTNSELHLVTVGPWSPDPAYATHEASFRWQTHEEVIEAIGKEAQQILDEQGKKIEEAGGAVQEAYVRRGRKDQEIVRLAEEIGAGLIVIGSRGRAGVRRALMGSVSDSVVRHAHCPVLVVRKQKLQAAL